MSTPGHRHSPFTIVMRGYDRDQVTDHIRRLEADVAMMAADRDSAHAHADEMFTHLEEARARIAELEHEVAALSVPPTTTAGMTERISRMLALATEEADEVRQNAADEAAETRSVAQQEAAALTADAQQQADRTLALAREHSDELTGKAEQTLAEARDNAASIIAAAQDDAAQLRGSSHHIAVARLARSRDLAQAAHDAHRQVLDHLAALREHLTDLPGALELSEDEAALVATTAVDDLDLLNRPLTGRDRFDLADLRDGGTSRSGDDRSADDGADDTAAERTDVLGTVDDEPGYSEYAHDEQTDRDHTGDYLLDDDAAVSDDPASKYA